MKQIIQSLLNIGMGAALLYHFILIHLYGRVLIQEPSTAILWTEIGLFAAATLFGTYMFVRALRRRR